MWGNLPPALLQFWQCLQPVRRSCSTRRKRVPVDVTVQLNVTQLLVSTPLDKPVPVTRIVLRYRLTEQSS